MCVYVYIYIYIHIIHTYIHIYIYIYIHIIYCVCYRINIQYIRARGDHECRLEGTAWTPFDSKNRKMLKINTTRNSRNGVSDSKKD